MKYRTAASSINPGREAARAQARQAAATPRPRGSGPRAVRLGDWLLDVDVAGRLVAVHTPSGARTVLATPPTTEEE